MGQYEQAIHDYDEAIRLDPTNARTYHDRGSSHRLLGNSKEAERDFQKAKELGDIS